MKIRHFLLLASMCVMVFVGGCVGLTSDHFAYRESAFRAEVCVTHGGGEVRAEISRSVGEDGREELCVRYLSPTPLEGICVRRDAAGRAVVSYLDGTLSRELDSAAVSRLLLPIEALMSCSTDARAVRRENGEVYLTFEDDSALVLTGDGVPRTLTTADGVSVTVVWWEKMN